MLGRRGEFEGVADWLPVLPLWTDLLSAHVLLNLSEVGELEDGRRTKLVLCLYQPLAQTPHTALHLSYDRQSLLQLA